MLYEIQPINRYKLEFLLETFGEIAYLCLTSVASIDILTKRRTSAFTSQKSRFLLTVSDQRAKDLGFKQILGFQEIRQFDSIRRCR